MFITQNKTKENNVMKPLKILILSCNFFLFLITNILSQGTLNETNNKISLNVKTYDNRLLPAQILKAEGKEKKLILFIHGSTPYDERGNIGPSWTDQGKIIAGKHEFYNRFLDVMVKKGYSIATMAKRSFVYPTEIPRPNFADLAFDIYYFILHLKKSNFIKYEKDLVIIGYSEGSIVATKVLGLLKKQPFACILLGSGSSACNFNKVTIDKFYMTDFLRKIKNWDDEQIQKEINQLAQIHDSLLNMDEAKFEEF